MITALRADDLLAENHRLKVHAEGLEAALDAMRALVGGKRAVTGNGDVFNLAPGDTLSVDIAGANLQMQIHALSVCEIRID